MSSLEPTRRPDLSGLRRTYSFDEGLAVSAPGRSQARIPERFARRVVQ